MGNGKYSGTGDNLCLKALFHSKYLVQICISSLYKAAIFTTTSTLPSFSCVLFWALQVWGTVSNDALIEGYSLYCSLSICSFFLGNCHHVIYINNSKPKTHTSVHYLTISFVFIPVWMVPSFWCLCAAKILFLLNSMYAHSICDTNNLSINSEFCTRRMLLVKPLKFGPVFIHHIFLLYFSIIAS